MAERAAAGILYAEPLRTFVIQRRTVTLSRHLGSTRRPALEPVNSGLRIGVAYAANDDARLNRRIDALRRFEEQEGIRLLQLVVEDPAALLEWLGGLRPHCFIS